LREDGVKLHHGRLGFIHGMKYHEVLMHVFRQLYHLKKIMAPTFARFAVLGFLPVRRHFIRKGNVYKTNPHSLYEHEGVYRYGGDESHYCINMSQSRLKHGKKSSLHALLNRAVISSLFL